MPEQAVNKTPEAKVLEKVVEAIREIKYGSVEITIHDSRIVQIETREKVRI